MNRQLLNVLVAPDTGQALALISSDSSEERVSTGVLRADSREFPITNGIPRFVEIEDAGQQQTANSFGFKWQQEETFGSESSKATYQQWVIPKYGFESVEEFRAYLGRDRWMLDAGCGAGLTASVCIDKDWVSNNGFNWVGVDISGAIDVAQKQLGLTDNMHYVQADLTKLPFQREVFDFIFSEGVLHHTPSTEMALKSLVPLLKKGGEIMFYVYRKKGPIREFTDDYVRDVMSDLPPQEAWKMMEPLTLLGKALAELKVEVDVPADIPYLGIKAGKQDVQRLLYYNVAKMFWNENYTFDENVHVNFDWYHPKYAHRQTEEDLRRWCDEASLNIIHLNDDPSGYTVRAVRE